jgi:hypothetical protein
MNKENYPFEELEPNLAYYFTSAGKNGKITKIVYFQPIEVDMYNIVLGDFNPAIQPPIDDQNISNNGDLPKVMATVAKILANFLKNNPQAKLYIEGNHPAKQLLYHRIVRNYHHELTQLFVINGVMDMEIQEPFAPEKLYESYIIQNPA